MATPASGPISISNINSAFGLGYALSAYRGVTWYQPNSLNTGTFSSSNLGMNQFYNKQSTDPASPGSVTYTNSGSFTVPLYRNSITFQVWGAGGGGGDAGGPTGSHTNGGAGGSSSITVSGNALVGNGGGGGISPASDRSGGAGGSAGSGSGGTSSASGTAGGNGQRQSAGGGGTGGNGGSGGAGGFVPGSGYYNGSPGNAPGGGGHFLEVGKLDGDGVETESVDIHEGGKFFVILSAAKNPVRVRRGLRSYPAGFFAPRRMTILG